MDQAQDFRDVAVLIPCYNEEITVGKVIDDFRRALPGATIYVFDNNSRDRTGEIARARGAQVVLSRRQGKGHVIKHMFEVVDAPIYIMTDGDDTYPAPAAPQLIALVREKGADMAVGVRMKSFEHKSFRRFHVFGNHMVATLISALFGVKVTDVLSGYRAFSRDLVKTLPLTSGGFEVETELTLQAAAKGFLLIETPVEYGTRPPGSVSKLNTYRDGVRVLRSIFLIFKDYKPLVFFTTIAAVLALASLAVAYRPVMEFVHERYIRAVPSAILATGLGVLAMLSLGVGLILDTVITLHNETFTLLRRQLKK